MARPAFRLEGAGGGLHGGVGWQRKEGEGKEIHAFAVLLCCLWRSFFCVSGDNLFSAGPFIQGLSTGVRQDGK